MSFIVIIPARMDSKRLPGKPLEKINGVPMIVQVARKASLSNCSNLYIATDSKEIFDVVIENGYNALMTSEKHNSGTERISEAVKTLKIREDEIVINVQGDEPLIEAKTINCLANRMTKDKRIEISTCAHDINNDELSNTNVVKVVFNLNHKALYFSRSKIPHISNNCCNDNFKDIIYKHIGIYGYRASFLYKFPELKVGKLELAESLEQLRFLENGYDIDICLVEKLSSIGVDTFDDLQKVRSMYHKI